jgi:hypothetical protein
MLRRAALVCIAPIILGIITALSQQAPMPEARGGIVLAQQTDQRGRRTTTPKSQEKDPMTWEDILQRAPSEPRQPGSQEQQESGTPGDPGRPSIPTYKDSEGKEHPYPPGTRESTVPGIHGPELIPPGQPGAAPPGQEPTIGYEPTPQRRMGGGMRVGTGPRTVTPTVVLYEENPADPNGKRFVGSVIWHTETVTPGPGQPPELADVSRSEPQWVSQPYL